MEESSTLEDADAVEEFVTRSAEETFEAGRRIGERIDKREILLLSGDLGAGKTVFAKGVASGLGVDPTDVTSPSFTLINIHEGRLVLYHVDLYRLDRDGCRGLGLEEIFEDDSAVTIIEWAERLGYVPPGATLVEIDYVSDCERRITIQRGKSSESTL
ncbi:MAG: tRNA (adenosine(37)-N6)-threonylcarbamoyltransferase complex ATPase subunit type 1 TsaE [Blastocatellia bacterium]|nr:tRNA (adenosine(37)-N6)-threonylcarbamoyltransferase complex ATPase subunit type 1 TsaE [Blastocatellia bacterium]